MSGSAAQSTTLFLWSVVFRNAYWLPGINEAKVTVLRELLGWISSGLHCASALGVHNSFVPLLLPK